MDIMKNGALLFALVCTGCIGSSLPFSLSKPQSQGDQMELAGSFVTSTGQNILLSDLKTKNTVVMFAQYFCEVCKHEAACVLQSLGASSFSGTNLITILVASDAGEAAQWKQLHKLPWTVGAIESTELLKQYCPQGQTPCTVIHRPGQGVKFIKQGETSAQEILNIIGKWD